MKFRLLSIAVAICASTFILSGQTPADSLILSKVDWQWKDLGRGAQSGHAQFEIFGNVRNISIVRYPARKHHTSIFSQTRELSNTTDSLARRAGALYAINGSYFNMKEFTPTTFLAINHEVLSPDDCETGERGTAIIAVKKKNGRKIEIFKAAPEEFNSISQKYYACMASGPLLLKDGQIVSNNPETSFNKTEHPRSIVGVTADGWVYMIVADGRMAPNATGLSVAQESAFCKWMGLKDALNLDGGGSSAIWTAEDGVLNCPCDNSKFDHKGTRRVPNIIGVQ